MSTREHFAKTPVIVLCGGKGTRLGTLTVSTPKCMVEVCGKPFLWHLLHWLKNQGFKRIILSTGHLAQQIQSYNFKLGMPIEFFKDEILGGPDVALAGLMNELDLHSFWIVNGDTMPDLDLSPPVGLGSVVYTWDDRDSGVQYNSIFSGRIEVRRGHYYDMGTVKGLRETTKYINSMKALK